MKKLLFLLTLFLTISCSSVRDIDRQVTEENLKMLQEKYKSSYIMPVRGYAYYFVRFDSIGVYEMNLKRGKIKTDTIRIYKK
jgi:hypothetical protein